MTGADRTWAARYEMGNVLHYQSWQQDLDIEKRATQRWSGMNPKENLLTVQKETGGTSPIIPPGFTASAAYREIEREFAVGDRLAFTAPNRELALPTATLEPSSRSARMGNSLSEWITAKTRVTFDPTRCATSITATP